MNLIQLFNWLYVNIPNIQETSCLSFLPASPHTLSTPEEF